jgi:hypothetical protein
MPENLRHTARPRRNQRNGILIGGYVKEDVAEYIRALAKADGATVSKFLNAHFLRLMNANKNKNQK